MKLNKNTLQWLVYDALHSDVAGHIELNLIEEIDDVLKDNTLEIEGYIVFSKEVETDEQFANQFSLRYGFTHWRPKPKAP